MAPPQPHPSHQSSKRKLSSKADLWRPWFATRQVQLLRQMPARSRFHAELRRCTCARRPRTPTANSQRGAPRSRVWTRSVDGPRNKQNNKANSIFYYCRRRSGEWRPAAAARNRGLGRSGTPTETIVISPVFELFSARPPARARHNSIRGVARAVSVGFWQNEAKFSNYLRMMGEDTMHRHTRGTIFYHKGPLPPIPSAVHQLRIEKREGGEGVRLWVDSLGAAGVSGSGAGHPRCRRKRKWAGTGLFRAAATSKCNH